MKLKLFTFYLLLLSSMLGVYAQVKVTGRVTNAKGEALAGAVIIEKGTSNGTFAEDDGSYLLDVSSNTSDLEYSFIGYLSRTVSIADAGTTFDVVLEEDLLQLGAVEIVGTRNVNRTAIESVTPIDIIPVKDLVKSVGQNDMNQILQFSAPSFNSNRQSGADGADHIDPATLRGLGPDQTLVLINGQRMHQSSLVNLYGTRGRGNTGTDLNTIPASAIERVEILRDGASAQYGSDAIAGVINVVLKKSTEEFNGTFGSGITQAGDGLNLQTSGNYGVKVGEKGYVNGTIDIQHRGHTFRNATMEDGSLYRRRFGDAKQNSYYAFANGSIPVSDNAEVYAFGGMSHRATDAYAYTRFPESPRNLVSIYPNGFDPIIESTVKDVNFTTGIKGNAGEWKLNLANTFGRNYMHYYVDSTLNASMLSASPTRFDAGGFALSQNITNLTASRFFEDVLSGLNVASGLEFRNENYRIFAGEESSWKNYGGQFIGEVDGQLDTITRPGGSQGFPGYRPENELSEYRTNIGTYLDLELNPIKEITLAGALRFENYSDFGNTLNYKGALRYDITDWIAIRASASSGFRAPSLAQKYFNSTFTNVVSGEAIDVVLAKNNSNLTAALGVGALKQEKSQNIGFGITAKPMNGLLITIDGYSIAVKDRIVLTGTFSPDTSTSWGRDLLAQNIGGIQFFTNALDTRTTGVDIIATYIQRLNDHRLAFTLAGNFNQMELGSLKVPKNLEGQESTLFGNREKLFLLASAPRSKFSFMTDYRYSRFNANLRFTHFAKIELEDWTGEIDVYDSRITSDLTVGYDIFEFLNLSVGGTNLFNAYPTLQNIETETGGRYDAVQMGFNGAYYFARLGLKF